MTFLKILFASIVVFFVTGFYLADAQVIFSDSFENDATSYNNPNTSSNPPWNNPVAGMAGETALTQVINAPTSASQGYIAGQDGNQHLVINTSAAGSEPIETDTITTVSGDAGNFQANTIYTLSVLMAQANFGGDGSPGNLFTGIFSIVDGSTVLASGSNNFATGDMDFHPYSLTFNTASNPSIVGDPIQISLEASDSAGSFQDAVEFDRVVLTAVTVPEPSSFVLLGLGFLLLRIIQRVCRGRLYECI